MLSYSVPENIQRQAYPAVLACAGFHDTRTAYWEAAKWVARLRAAQLGPSPILLKVNFEAGHLRSSDRYKKNQEIAIEYAFVLSKLGLERASEN